VHDVLELGMACHWTTSPEMLEMVGRALLRQARLAQGRASQM
jgi:hypothetical protein